MQPPPRVSGSRRLVWAYHGPLAGKLDAATWLETTREVQKLSWRVSLIAIGPNGQHTVDGVDVLGVDVPDLYLIRHVFFHARLVSHILRNWQQTDIVLFHPRSALWLLPLRFLRQLRRNKGPLLLMDTRDLDPAGGHGMKHLLRRAHGALVRYLAGQWADGQTAITERMARLVRIPDNRLWGTWPSGVDLEHFAAAQGLRKWPGDTEPVQLVYTGALTSQRNLLAMCQAVESANAEGMKFRLFLYGEGPVRAELESFSLSSAGRIGVFSAIPHDQIPCVLAEAHVGVSSLFSPNEELFQASSPIKLFEYMAAGLPILAVRMPCHTDVINDAPCVFWAEDPTVEGLAAALRALWSSRSSLPRAGRAAAQLAQNYTWAASARKFAQALEYGLTTRGPVSG